jgi:hypothetical protein
VHKILKQISKDVKETARIQGDGEDTFLQYYGKLWNTTNINELQLEYNSADYSHASITLDELENTLKLTKHGKTPGQNNINSELYTYAPEEFKLRLLQFFKKYIYRENRIPNERRNAVITPMFKKGDRREPKNYRGISILNTCYTREMYFKIINMKLQNFLEAFMTKKKRNTKMKIHKTIIRPVVTDSLDINSKNENNLRTFERQILRKIFGPVNIDNIWRIRNNMEIVLFLLGNSPASEF